MHLVDARAIPQVQLYAAAGAGILAGDALARLPPLPRTLAGIASVAFLCWYASSQVEKFPDWAGWNYSGWETKKNWPEFAKLATYLRGNLDDPRIAFEQSVEHNDVGTERVFEMLPYFANRATTESLYMQSTILSQAVFHLQAEISERPSCPFAGLPCNHFNVKATERHLRLLGVGQVIVSTPPVIAEAKASPFLKLEKGIGAWTVFGVDPKPPLVKVVDEAPKVIEFAGWRQNFWDWFADAPKGKDILLMTAEPGRHIPKFHRPNAKKPCHPVVHADFSGIALATDCPGRMHLLNFAYQPTFRADNGDEIFLLSPGMLGIVPSAARVKLTYGSSMAWLVSDLTSGLAALALLANRKRRFTWSKHVLARLSTNQSALGLQCMGFYQAHHRKFAGLALAAVLAFYGSVSYHVDSPYFWEWRQIHLPGIAVKEVTQGWGVLKKNQGLSGEVLTVGGQPLSNSLTTHAASQITVTLKSAAKKFSGLCAYPDYMHGARIQCEVRSGSSVLFSSPPLSDEKRFERFELGVKGNRNLTLIVRSLDQGINSAHAVWGNLRVQ